MKNLSAHLGFAMSILAIAALLVYTACFVAILLVNKPFKWSNFEAFVKYETDSHTAFKYIGMACMIVFACAFAILTVCLTDAAYYEKKLLGNISVIFALAFCVTICISYYIQITATRLQLKSNPEDGLVQFTQSYNISAVNSINMLGWTLFYAISTLFLSFLFEGDTVDNVIKWFCLANTFVMLIGLVGYIKNHFLTLAFSMNLGLGAVAFGMLVPMAIRFLYYI